MVEGGPCGRPAFFCGMSSVLDGCLLPPWACLGYRGAAAIVDAAVQGCHGSANLLDYPDKFM